MTIRTIKKKGLTTRRQTIGGLHSIDFMIYGSITKFGSQSRMLALGAHKGFSISLANKNSKSLIPSKVRKLRPKWLLI